MAQVCTWVWRLDCMANLHQHDHVEGCLQIGVRAIFFQKLANVLHLGNNKHIKILESTFFTDFFS